MVPPELHEELHATCSEQSHAPTIPICTPNPIEQFEIVNEIDAIPPSVTKAHQLLLLGTPFGQSVPPPTQAVGFE